MKSLNTAIIGCGNIYRVHADIVEKMNNINLKYVVDIKEERAKKAAEKYNCSYLTDYTELLDKEINVVHVCTPHFLHSPMAVKFLKAGINVLVEKPLALNYKEGKKIIKAQKESSAKLGVCFQNRFNENNMRAKKILETGSLGKIKGIKGFVTWHRNKNYYLKDDWKGSYDKEGGGVLINQAIHTLDLIQWFVGPVRSVKGTVDTRVLEDVIEVEDTAEATLYFENNTVGLFYATNTFTDNSPIEIVIDCEKGNLRLFDNKLLVKQDDNIDCFNENDRHNYKAYWGYGHQKLIKSFYNDLESKNNDIIINAKEGIKTLELIKAINISSDKRKKVYLKGEDIK